MTNGPSHPAQKWQSAVRPWTLLRAVEGVAFNDRRWRLLASAFCRLHADVLPPGCLALLEASERIADGQESMEHSNDLCLQANRITREVENLLGVRWRQGSLEVRRRRAACAAVCYAVLGDAWGSLSDENLLGDAWLKAEADLVRCVFANPFRPLVFSACWRTPLTTALARTAYDQRDFSILPILGDALIDAGCDNEDILTHCHGPGPHSRGCWVLDALLGR
jgi:hypothetical protein